MARFKTVERLKKFGEHTCVGAGGDLSDFQYICDLLDETMCLFSLFCPPADQCNQLVLPFRSEEDAIEQDGMTLGPRNLHAYLCRVLYNRRSKMDPLWNSLVVGGHRNGER